MKLPPFPPPQLQFRQSRDPAHASIPLAQTPWGLTGRAWLQAGAQRGVIAVDPSFNSLGFDSRNGRPCTRRRRVQGRSQGTTLSASDLHNARATILNPFYNMEYKIIKKIRQNTTWIEADILGINLTPNRYNPLASAIVYVSDDVTIPFNSVTSQ